jgi:hypothetical protein
MALTKNQFALVLLPTLFVLFVLDLLYYRQLRVSHFLVPIVMTGGAIVAGYLALFLLALRTDDPGHILTLWHDASAGAIFVFSRGRMLSSLKFLLGPDVLSYWGLPSLFYGVILARERNRNGIRQAFLVTFAVIGLGWYAFASIGWPRYAFASLAILPIFAAKLITDVIHVLARSDGPWFDWRGTKINVAAAALVAAVILTIGFSLQSVASTVAAPPDRGPQLMAAYIDSHVPRSDVIETWEPELGFLSNHSFHYPPSGWLDRAVRAKWLGATDLLNGYDPGVEAKPAFLVVGPFGKFTGMYQQILANLHTPPVVSVGDYDLYRLR